jgi:hypothetical protein
MSELGKTLASGCRSSHLPSLIERLKAAEGPSRELDFWLTIAMDDEPCNETIEDLLDDIEAVGFEGMYIEAPFTKSLDATIALAERKLPGWEGIIPLNKGDAWLWSDPLRKSHRVEAATPVLSLLTALLTALQEQEEGR